MKKILFLTPTLPYPPVSGGVIKSNKIVQFLNDKYSLSVACFLKNDDKLHVQEFRDKFIIQHFIAEELNVARSAKNFLISNLQNIPLNLYRNKSVSFKNKIHKVIHEHDVIFCDHYVMFQYIPDNYKGKIILHEHNCEYLIWKRYAGIEKNIIKKIALLNQAYRIKKYELEICKKSHIILAAPNDTAELVQIGADERKFMETYHLGDDSLLEKPDLVFNEKEKSLLYVGTLSWEANIDGLLWFIDKIWPDIKTQQSGITLYIVGKNPDNRLKSLVAKDTSILLTGFVDDLEPYFQKCAVFITPLRFGSGIKVKVVNALYRGIPCVTTSIGAEGLKTIDGEHVFIKDNTTEFAACVNKLYKEKETWRKLSENSRKLAHLHYTWNAVLNTILEAIER